MQWTYNVNLDWLKARQKYLTASDIKKLVPFTKTGRARNVTDIDYLKVWASKQVELDLDDCVATGAAARGHLLEPFAIGEYSTAIQVMNIYHWDDCLIHKGVLAFSPDALSIPCDRTKIEIAHNEIKPKLGLEIKSYAAEKHIECIVTDKSMLEERWQLATAFAVCDSLDVMEIAFYNPSIELKLGVKSYTREDLEKEIETVRDIEIKWTEFINNVDELIDKHSEFKVIGKPDQDKIIELIKEKQEFNPIG